MGNNHPPTSPAAHIVFPGRRRAASNLPSAVVPVKASLEDLPRCDVLPQVLDFLGARELGTLACVGSPSLRGAVCTAWRNLLERQWPEDAAKAPPGRAAAAVRAKLAEGVCTVSTPTFKCFPKYALPSLAHARRDAPRVFDAVYGAAQGTVVRAF